MSDQNTATRKYSDIRAKFAEREDAVKQFVTENNKFVILVTEGFRKFMDMPQFWERHADGGIFPEPYTPLFMVGEDGSFTKPKQWWEAVQHFPDGTFFFGLGVILEREENAAHKHCLPLRIDCARHDGVVDVKIDGKIVTCKFDGEAAPDIEMVHNRLLEVIEEWLAARWGSAAAKPSFGFDIS